MKNNTTKLVSWNVPGVPTKSKTSGQGSTGLFQKIQQWSADIHCIQETHISTEQEAMRMRIAWAKSFGKSVNSHTPDLQSFSFWSSEQRGPLASSHCGTAILINPRSRAVVKDVFHREDGRATAVRMDLDGEDLSVWSLYVPSKRAQQADFFADLDLQMHRFPNPVIGGDLNTWLSPILDYVGERPGVPHPNATVLRAFMQQHDLSDTFRELHPEAIETTRQPGGKNLFPRTRLDYWLLSERPNQEYSVKHLDAARMYSDHSPVLLTLSKPPGAATRGPGYWCINNSLLQDDDFLDEMQEKMEEEAARDPAYETQATRWEAMKVFVRRAAIEFSVRKSKAEYAAERAINNELRHVKRVLALYPRDENSLRRRDSLLAALGAHEKRRTMGAAVRARAIMEAENGNRGSSYFFSLEKSRGQKTLIRELFDPTTHERKRVPTSIDPTGPMRNYMMQLFASPDAAEAGVEIDEADNRTDDQAADEVLATVKKRLTKQQRRRLERAIDLQELKIALKSLNKSSSPGADGLSAALVVRFFAVLGPMLLAVIHEALSEGTMPETMRGSLVKFLHKGGDAADPQKYRPISLTGIDYRCLGKIIAIRLTEILASLVHHSQTASIPGRNIVDNVALLQSLREFARVRGIKEGLFLFIDFRRAYDLVNRHFLDRVLETFGFGPAFRDLVKLLNNGATAAICVNGFTSTSYRLTKGLRQGCCASMALFVLYIESLGCYLRAAGLAGFPMPRVSSDAKCVSVFFADDATLTLIGLGAMRQALRLIQRFCEASGARLNTGKSKALWVGTDPPPVAHEVADIEDVKWIHLTGQPNRSLGMLWGASVETVWEDMTTKILNSAITWNRRGMGLRGRILIAKQMLLSRAVYLALIVPPPPRAVAEITAILHNYVHRKFEKDDDENKVRKPANFATEILIGVRAEGGQQLLDFGRQVSALAFSWFRRLLDATPSNWKAYALWDLLGRPTGDDRRLRAPHEALVDLPACERAASLPIVVTAIKAARSLAFGRLQAPDCLEAIMAVPLFDNPFFGQQPRTRRDAFPRLAASHLTGFTPPQHFVPFHSANLLWVRTMQSHGLTCARHLLLGVGADLVRTWDSLVQHRGVAVRQSSYTPLRLAMLNRWAHKLGNGNDPPAFGEYFRLPDLPLDAMAPPGVRVGLITAMKGRKRLAFCLPGQHTNEITRDARNVDWTFVLIDGTRHKVEHFTPDQLAHCLTVYRVDPATNTIDQLDSTDVWYQPTAIAPRPRLYRVRVVERKPTWRHADPMDRELIYYGDLSSLVIDPLRWGIPIKQRGGRRGMTDSMLLLDISVRNAYRALADFTVKRPPAEQVWESEWGLRVSSRDWRHTYAIASDICLPTTTQELLYKLVVRRFWCAKRLHGHGLADSAKCKHCGGEENHTHLFYACAPALTLWRRVLILLTAYTKVKFVPTARSVITGVLDDVTWNQVKKRDRKFARSVWRTTRAFALDVIRRARNALYHNDVAYDADALFFAWRAEVTGCVFRNELFPQGRRIGQRVERWTRGDVYARRDGTALTIVCKPK